MVDSPYYRPPEGDPDQGAPAQLGRSGQGVAPVPFDPTLRGSGVADSDGPSDAGEAAAESIERGEQSVEAVEEMWEILVTTDEPQTADRMAADLQEAGFETWVRIRNEVDFSTGMTRVFDVLVHEEQAEAAAVVADDTAVQMAEESAAFDLDPRPVGSDGCRSTVFVGGIILLVALAVLLVATTR